jgi:hypothetical protein
MRESAVVVYFIWAIALIIRILKEESIETFFFCSELC